jgi:L,D-peptidoglycan transpeptidase YkuD (ErfK/YbiS/YcfS/YnhG family)
MARSRPRDYAARRKITVDRSSRPTILQVSPKPGDKTKGVIRVHGRAFACALGRSGIAAIKHEGDGRTPRARMKVLFAIHAKDRWPFAWRQSWLIGGKDPLGWCDAPDSANYNRAVRLPFAPSHELLSRDDRLYDCIIVLDWNMTKRAAKRGSAIFLHIARAGFVPTEGCIAVEPSIMAQLVRMLRPGSIVKTN